MCFGPDAEMARVLDARMQQGLRESVEYIAEAVERGIEDAENGDVRTALAELHEIVSAIPAAHRYSPAAFGYYYELAFALTENDLEAARVAAAQLSRCVSNDGGSECVQIFNLGQHKDRDAMYLRRLGGLEGASFNAPPDSAAADFAPRLEGARRLLQRCAPELLDEIDVIVREIVLAVGRPEEKIQFDGGSVYQLWGMLFLNPAFHPTPIALAEVLAHESGHSILFGHTYDEPLVYNPDTDLFPSPLRLDPRPMDGIYHATYVSARMHWTMSRIANDRSATAEERDAARKAAEADMANFTAGIGVIDAHGQLSAAGRALIEEARTYMKSAA